MYSISYSEMVMWCNVKHCIACLSFYISLQFILSHCKLTEEEKMIGRTVWQSWWRRMTSWLTAQLWVQLPEITWLRAVKVNLAFRLKAKSVVFISQEKSMQSLNATTLVKSIVSDRIVQFNVWLFMYCIVKFWNMWFEPFCTVVLFLKSYNFVC